MHPEENLDESMARLKSSLIGSVGVAPVMLAGVDQGPCFTRHLTSGKAQ